MILLNRLAAQEVKILAYNLNDCVTVVLGDEFDNVLREKLINILRVLGAKNLVEAERLLAGSQEIEELDVYVESNLIHVEAETYIGLSITGPESIVKDIQRKLNDY